jgi:spore maturation protein CgeB
MRIMIVCPWGKTASELGGFCKHALGEIGHAVDIFLYNDERISSRIPALENMERALTEKALSRKISHFRPTLILVIKGDRIPLEVIHGIKEKFEVLTANYWIDDPYAIDVSKKISPSYDYFFTNDPDCVQIHEDAGCHHVGFLSFGCFPPLHRNIQLSEKEYKAYGSDVCFAGTVSEERLRILETLSDLDLRVWSPRHVVTFRKEYQIEKNILPPSSPLYHRFTNRSVWGEELVKVYNASKIVLNIHSPQSVPIMRDFEVTGCGSFLLTDDARSLATMFRPREEIICWGNLEELREMAAFYLSHPEERKKIARRGEIRANQDHTYTKKMGELVSFIEENRP